MKRFALLLFAGLFFASCGQQGAKQEEAEVATIGIAELVTTPMDFENQEVSIEGVINHMCRHSGDKLRLAEIGGEGLSIEVMLGEFASQFNPELEGKELAVTGILKTSVSNMDALEAELENAHEGEEGHECETTEEAIAKMKELGIDPNIVAYIEMTGFELK
ncbi:MAG: hypothetical protein V2I46_05370 [Bacteroides sp.]|jgi:hypothetical protein|nr:hypothetical protein [Bacteroides sp.]